MPRSPFARLGGELNWFYGEGWEEQSSLALFHEQPERREPPVFLIGVDLGQASDPTAIVTSQRIMKDELAHYLVGHIDRLPLGTKYPVVVEHLRTLVETLKAMALADQVDPEIRLILDYTGVGRPIADMVVAANIPATSLSLITITSGDAETEVDGAYRVPKRNLAATAQVVLQSGRLEIANELPMAGLLTSEMAGFRAKIRATGSVAFEAGDDWRSAQHDDLVLALAMALWDGENSVSYTGAWVF